MGYRPGRSDREDKTLASLMRAAGIVHPGDPRTSKELHLLCRDLKLDRDRWSCREDYELEMAIEARNFARSALAASETLDNDKKDAFWKHIERAARLRASAEPPMKEDDRIIFGRHMGAEMTFLIVMRNDGAAAAAPTENPR